MTQLELNSLSKSFPKSDLRGPLGHYDEGLETAFQVGFKEALRLINEKIEFLLREEDSKYGHNYFTVDAAFYSFKDLIK